MTKPGPEIRHSDVQRVSELVSLGAGQAASAYAQLLGRSFLMRPPQSRILSGERLAEPLVHAPVPARQMAGIFFELEGGLGGVAALLFGSETRDRLVELLTGRSAKELGAEQVDSALREIGNILVSHVASALSDTLAVAVLPSVPILVEEDAPSALASLVSLRDRDEPSLCIETEIYDTSGEIRSVLVFVPDRTISIARPKCF